MAVCVTFWGQNLQCLHSDISGAFTLVLTGSITADSAAPSLQPLSRSSLLFWTNYSCLCLTLMHPLWQNTVREPIWSNTVPLAVGQRSVCELSEGCSTVPSRTQPHRGFERWGKGSRVLVAGVSAVGAAARISLDSSGEEAERCGRVVVLQWCLLAVTPPQPVTGGKGWSYHEGIGSPVRSGCDFWWSSCFCHGV